MLVGIVGRLTEIKNHELFFRHLAIQESPRYAVTAPVKFVVIGDGSLREGLERPGEAGLERRCYLRRQSQGSGEILRRPRHRRLNFKERRNTVNANRSNGQRRSGDLDRSGWCRGFVGDAKVKPAGSSISGLSPGHSVQPNDATLSPRDSSDSLAMQN